MAAIGPGCVKTQKRPHVVPSKLDRGFGWSWSPREGSYQFGSLTNSGKESKKVGEQQVALAGYRLVSLIGHAYRSKSLTLFPCADGEANQDIVRSVNNIKKNLSDSGISWEQEKDNKCGYLLKYSGREKLIEGAMTDVDLWMELKDFLWIVEFPDRPLSTQSSRSGT